MGVPAGAGRFDDAAEGYAATMAPSLEPIAREVVRRAALQAGERVLDLGTGTGIAAAAAVGDGRTVVGIDVAPGMLRIARQSVPGASFEEMDFEALAFEDESFDVVLAAHALLFATDQIRALREWLRVTGPGGRLSLSVPGPTQVTPTAIYAEIYARHGIGTSNRYPSEGSLGAMARSAGWEDVATAADPTRAIRLADEAAFRTWRSIGFRGGITADYSPAQQEALTAEMLAATPVAADGSYRIPFGALYLTGRRR